MVGNPIITIVGPGKLGGALAMSLQRARYKIATIVGHSAKTRAMASRLAAKVGARTKLDLRSGKSKVVWFCVPDSQIENAASSLAKEVIDGRGMVALHSSGALSSDELAVLKQRGMAVASVHPLMTFVRGFQPSLAGVPFAIEGDARAVKTARQIVRDLGGSAFAIRKDRKAAYHAWGMFASPLLTALLATTEEVAQLSGIRRKDAKERMVPILMQTLSNYASFGAAGAFSGPIIRGDVETVKSHLKVLRKTPALLDVYIALATSALTNLPARDKQSLKRALSSIKK